MNELLVAERLRYRSQAPAGAALEELPEDYGVAFSMEMPNGVEVHIHRMIFNWRISEVDGWMSYGRSWCFEGVGPWTFRRAVEAALTWGGDPASEPPGHLKANQ
jgi:hypothetical protein